MSDFLSVVNSNPWLMLLILSWELVWKGMALWLAARQGHKFWFILILLVNIVNTLGLLPLFYLVFVSGEKFWEKKKMARMEPAVVVKKRRK